MNHPKILSPLAKQHRDFPELTERFELFVDGMELSNGYSELNDPEEQLLRFKSQLKVIYFPKVLFQIISYKNEKK